MEPDDITKMMQEVPERLFALDTHMGSVLTNMDGLFKQIVALRQQVSRLENKLNEKADDWKIHDLERRLR